ncbi:U3 small nucleolar RNA-associated protein-like protein [Zostera marina]|uniref:U3 small nucleolar RNA-associated protein 18 homolog n=1 Tax=Zostera marina TaxID=29655 RepID=A0A0K9NRJ1_ZOSMR|nr:U3 small nucleolar RNA-associated protein-like protein [Zostera marina]
MSLISQNAVVKRRRDDSSEIENNLHLKTMVSSDPIEVIKNQKKNRRERSEQQNDAKDAAAKQEKKNLTSSLFGLIYSPPVFGAEDGGEGEEEHDASEPVFFVDRSVDADTDRLIYQEDFVSHEKRPAWVDEEDEILNVNIDNTNRLRKMKKVAGKEGLISGIEYASRLRAQHIKLNPGTDWANSEVDDADDSEDESGITITCQNKNSESDDILRSADNLVLKGGERLLPGILEHTRLMDANSVDPSNAPIHSVQFHRNAQLLLAAGLDRRLRFFQVDGKRNPKVQSVFINDCPIRKAAFLPDGSQVIISGRRSFFYNFDLVNAKADKIGPLTGRNEKSLESFEISPDSKTIAFIGNEGYILLVSTKTKQLIGTLKMNGTCRSLSFTEDGKFLLSSGGDGKIYNWDIGMRRCVHVGVDDGSLTGSALCTSPDSRFFASGSSTGIVNLYKKEDFLNSKNKKPLKIVANLTTTVSQVKFNHDAQILAILSSMKTSSLKLVHIPSFTVYSNFPNPNANLKFPKCLDFSPRGGFMAVGNAAGNVLLYKLHHYQNA